MKITRKDIANYKLLKVLLEKDRRKLDRYIAKQPSTYSGKVYGSNPQFPYEARGFTVGGCTDAEIRQREEWDSKCRELETLIQDDIRKLNELEMKIDRLIVECQNVEDKLILEYTKDGLSQEKISEKIGLERSVISRRIKKYITE